MLDNFTPGMRLEYSREIGIDENFKDLEKVAEYVINRENKFYEVLSKIITDLECFPNEYLKTEDVIEDVIQRIEELIL